MEIDLDKFRLLAQRVRAVVPEDPMNPYAGLCSLSPDALEGLLDLLDRAGEWIIKSGTLAGGADHDRKGRWHKVYPRPGEWDIEQDEPGCDYGYWLLPDGVTEEDEEDSEEYLRVQVKECTCGFNDLLRELGQEVD